MERIRQLGRELSNWGRWGPDDQRGTLNFITPEVVRRATACVRSGRVFSLGLPLGPDGPQIGQGGRVNPLHFVTALHAGYGSPDGFHYNDDVLLLPLQAATQWDSLAHVYYDGTLYNGVSASAVSSSGAARNGIDAVGNGVLTRGVLLDIARLEGVERLPPGFVIRPEHLEAAEKAERVRVSSGDALLVRTGHITVFTREQNREGYMRQMPGLGLDCARWLHAREVCAVATDTNAVEVIPFEDPSTPLPLHLVCIRDMGLTLGEMFYLEELAEACAADGEWAFLLAAPVLKVRGGLGTPLNPLAVK
ncbi:MAG: cyclase family protein [Candidatus Binatia bacterium]|nr:cyclase family protein [Candidatus Binatia bacterium]